MQQKMFNLGLGDSVEFEYTEIKENYIRQRKIYQQKDIDGKM